MRKEKVIGVFLVMAVIAALFAAEWYFFDYLPRKAEYELEGIGPLPEESNLGGAAGDNAETFQDFDSGILVCTDPQRGTVYTDKKTCDDAWPEEPAPVPDLDN